MVWGIVSAVLIWWSFSKNEQILLDNLSLIEANYAVQTKIMQSHLWFEEYLAGDTTLTLDDFIAGLAAAREEVLVIRDHGIAYHQQEYGGSWEENNRLIAQVEAALDRFEHLASVRVADFRAAGIGSDLDEEFDRAHSELSDLCKALNAPIRNHIHSDVAQVRWIFWSVTSVWTILLAFTLTVLYQRQKAARESSLASQRSEDRFQRLFHKSPEAILLHTLDGQIVEANIAAGNLLGYDHQFLLSLNLSDLFAESNSEILQTTLQSLRNQGSKQWGSPMLKSDGAAIIAEISSTVSDNRTGMVQSFFRDITESVNTSRKMKKISTVVAQSANTVCIMDIDGTIEYVNPQFCRVAGYSITEAIGRSVKAIQPVGNTNLFYKKVWDRLATGKTWSGNLHTQRKDGQEYWERKTFTPILDDAGETSSYLSIGEDITTELHTQQKLAEADKLSAIGTLAAGVAHEFKNYLGGIIGNASYALDDIDNEGGHELARETLEQIIHMGERANDVAMSLLTYSKAQPEDVTDEDLEDIVLKSLNLVEKEMKTNAIEIATYFEPIPKLPISVSKIQQLLLNLLINAQHAIGANGVITVSLMENNGWVLLRVSDSGHGILEEVQSKIFDPFYSTKGVWGKDEITGTGMGLPICRNIAREHGGDLTVKSIPEIGTNFTLSLPITSEKPQPVTIEHDTELRVMIFSLEKTIIKKYHAEACQRHVTLIATDNIDNIPKDIDKLADLVVCDAKFTGKMELYRLVELCARCNIPHVMINCGQLEYQIIEIHESAAANFKELPDFQCLYEIALPSIRNTPATLTT